MADYSCMDIESEKDEERRRNEWLHLCRGGDADNMKSRVYFAEAECDGQRCDCGCACGLEMRGTKLRS
jgi:hypothetical protein